MSWSEGPLGLLRDFCGTRCVGAHHIAPSLCFSFLSVLFHLLVCMCWAHVGLELWQSSCLSPTSPGVTGLCLTLGSMSHALKTQITFGVLREPLLRENPQDSGLFTINARSKLYFSQCQAGTFSVGDALSESHVCPVPLDGARFDFTIHHR